MNLLKSRTTRCAWLARCHPTKIGLTAGLTLTLSAGCAVGPDFHRPALPANTAYMHGHAPAKTVVSPGPSGVVQMFVRAGKVRADWYRLFRSPGLNRLIHLALINSPTLRASQARLLAARENLTASEGALYPQIDINAAVRHERASGIRLGIEDPMFVNVFELYQGQITLDYNLDVFGELRRRVESRQARLEFQRYQLWNTYLTLINNVVATSLAEASINAILNATHQIVNAEAGTLKLLHGQERYGAAAPTDVLRSQVQLSATRANLPPLEKQLAIVRNRLAILTGQTPGTFQEPDIKLKELTLPRRLPVSLSSHLVRQRPDILAAQSLLHAASARVGVATTRLLPSFNLSASYGRNALSLGDLADPIAAIYSFGVGLMAPVFHGGALRAQQRAARALYQAAAADYYNRVLVAFAQVADSLRALQSDAEALKAQNAALQAARRNLDLVRHQLRQGAADYLNLFNAQAQYQRVLINYTAAKLQRYRDTATLFRALGGGWWNLKGNSLDPRDIALAEPHIRAPSVTNQLGRL